MILIFSESGAILELENNKSNKIFNQNEEKKYIMERVSSLIVKLSLAVIVFCSANYAGASFMQSWLQPFKGPGQNISVLIVTGNYSKSRILAELVQKYNGQPMLLVPFASANSSQDIFFVPPQKSGKALRVPYTEMTNFINFLNPKMVLVLGGPDYVPDAYYKMISDNRPIVRVSGADWYKNADTVGSMLNLSNVPGDYKKLLEQLQSDTNYQRSAPQVPEYVAQPVVEAPIPVVEKPVIVEAAPVLVEKPKVIDASQK